MCHRYRGPDPGWTVGVRLGLSAEDSSPDVIGDDGLIKSYSPGDSVGRGRELEKVERIRQSTVQVLIKVL